MENKPIKDRKRCSLASLAFILIVLIVAVLSSCSKKDDSETSKTITLKELCSSTHPMVGDNKDVIKAYYKDYDDVSIQHLSDIEYTNTLTWRFSTVYGDNSYNHLVLSFSYLSVEEQKQLTLEKVIDIVMSFIPAEEIVEYYAFDKAIYVERDGYVEYELYYKEIDEKINNRPNKFYLSHGFSFSIKEYSNNQFEASIATTWYDYIYDTNPIIGAPTSNEEFASHKEWQFSLEKYIDSKKK